MEKLKISYNLLCNALKTFHISFNTIEEAKKKSTTKLS